jgi:D-alanyl-D-alanine carboxypeptidase/D-alanyl-D-alanine-endopeptidase (penicillin-binding protein 4)
MGFTQHRNDLLFLTFYFLILTSCSLQKQISKSATAFVLKDSSLTTAHVGISIYEPATSKYWYNYQGDHYFVPASNTKIPTCYAAMKYLGDSLVTFLIKENADSIFLKPCADPTFLDNEYPNQQFFNYL